MHWARKFVMKNPNATDYDVVTDETLSQYVSLLDDFTTHLKITFPKSLIMWRDLPSTGENGPSWPLWDVPNYVENGNPEIFRNTYIDSLNIAAEEMFAKNHSEIIRLPWNKVTRGIMTWADQMHPDGPATKFVVNMWLFFIKSNFKLL